MISVVIPLLNESNLVSKLIDEIFKNLQLTGEAFEIVCVDDGSTDSTLQKLLEFRNRNSGLKVISLSRNFGLQAALTAGLDFAKGIYLLKFETSYAEESSSKLIKILVTR